MFAAGCETSATTRASTRHTHAMDCTPDNILRTEWPETCFNHHANTMFRWIQNMRPGCAKTMVLFYTSFDEASRGGMRGPYANSGGKR